MQLTGHPEEGTFEHDGLSDDAVETLADVKVGTASLVVAAARAVIPHPEVLPQFLDAAPKRRLVSESAPITARADFVKDQLQLGVSFTTVVEHWEECVGNQAKQDVDLWKAVANLPEKTAAECDKPQRRWLRCGHQRWSDVSLDDVSDQDLQHSCGQVAEGEMVGD